MDNPAVHEYDDVRLRAENGQLVLEVAGQSIPVDVDIDGNLTVSGNVEIPDGDLDVDGEVNINTSAGSVYQRFLNEGEEKARFESGSSGDAFYLRDKENERVIYIDNDGGHEDLQFRIRSGEVDIETDLNVGGDVEIPNGNLEVVDGSIRVVRDGDFSTEHFKLRNVSSDPANWSLRTRGGSFVLRDSQSSDNPIRLIVRQSGVWEFNDNIGNSQFTITSDGDVEIPRGDLEVGNNEGGDVRIAGELTEGASL